MQTPKERFSRLVDADVLDSMKSSIVDVSDGCYMPPYVYASEEWFEFRRRPCTTGPGCASAGSTCCASPATSPITTPICTRAYTTSP